MNMDWVDKYLSKDHNCLGVYIALLALRFDRRSNYEKIINIDELLNQYKITYNTLLGPENAHQALKISEEFIFEVFNKCPKCLEAKTRFKFLDEIESKYYSIFRKVLYRFVNIYEIPDEYREYFAKILEHVKYGRISAIDRTSSGSVYILRYDLYDVDEPIKNVSEIDRLIPYMYKLGIFKASNTRCIIPAPILEDKFIMKLRGFEFEEYIKGTLSQVSIKHYLTQILTSMKYDVKSNVKMLSYEQEKIDLIASKEIGNNRFIIWILTRWFNMDLTDDKIRKILEMLELHESRPNLVIILCKRCYTNLHKRFNFFIIELGELKVFEDLVDRVRREIFNIFLEISPISRYLDQALSILNELKNMSKYMHSGYLVR